MTAISAWREQMRQDRLLAAQIERDRETARSQVRIAEAQARARERREVAYARAAARQHAREDRAASRAALAQWLGSHVVDLLFVPVIGVPAALAWTSMASYGLQVYGPIGLALPAFSEGAMWAFAAATTITHRRYPGRPLWHLRLGTLVFAGYGAVLNFTHGLTNSSGPSGPGIGLVMAVVSVAGVVAHQLVTAGPRRSRAERAGARIARKVARREMAARRAAIRRAAADVDEHGNARLVYEPGLNTLTRYRRTRVDTGPDTSDTGPDTSDTGPGTGDTGPDTETGSGRPGRDLTDLEAQALAELSADPDLSGAELARRLGIGTRRGQRLISRLTPQLHPADAARSPQPRTE